MATPLSSSSSILTAAEFLARVDHRTVGDLVSDDGSKLDYWTLIGPPVATNLQTALDSAMGQLEASMLVGERYNPTDLAALTGASLAYLYRVLSDLTHAELVKRRPERRLPLPEGYKDACELLKALREGSAVFGLQEAADAGKLNRKLDTAADVEARNLVTYQARRFFGTRSNRRPLY